MTHQITDDLDTMNNAETLLLGEAIDGREEAFIRGYNAEGAVA